MDFGLSETQHVDHGVQPRRFVLGPERGAHGAPGIDLAARRLVGQLEALARAGDYWQPGALELELGSPVTAGAPDLTPQGFDRASGCHVIAPDRGRVRFVIDGREHPRFSPAFKIIDSEGLDAWVYVNHLIFHPIAHDADGNLIFQLPDVITDRTTVEVLLRPPPVQRP